jgi:hypothetical protein
MRLIQTTRRAWLPLVAGLVIAALPTAASAARAAPGPMVVRGQAHPAGDVVDRTKAKVAARPAKTRAATKSHRR